MSCRGLALLELDESVIEAVTRLVVPDDLCLLHHTETAENELRLQSESDFSLRGKINIKNKYIENGFSLCNSVTGDSAGRIVPPDEVLASAELARQRNRRDRDLIALMYPSNVIEWTWIEHADGTWTAHHSITFEEVS